MLTQLRSGGRGTNKAWRMTMCLGGLLGVLVAGCSSVTGSAIPVATTIASSTSTELTVVPSSTTITTTQSTVSTSASSNSQGGMFVGVWSRAGTTSSMRIQVNEQGKWFVAVRPDVRTEYITAEATLVAGKLIVGSPFKGKYGDIEYLPLSDRLRFGGFEWVRSP